MVPSETELKRVDYFAVTFLVDNSIEWMTRLPPGFKHEMRQHLSEHPIIDPLTGVPFLDLENYCCGAHGFSALIETSVGEGTKHYTLFDTGPDSRSLVRNVESLHVPIEQIDRVILSHWHADHSGGLLSFLRLRQKAVAAAAHHGSSDIPQEITIDLHPSRPVARGIAPPPNHDTVIARLPADPTFAEIQNEGGTLDVNDVGHVVADGTVYVSGEIPRITDFEGGLLGGMRWTEGHWLPENHIMDERYALVDVLGKGLVIFTACSHAGVVNVVRDAVSKFSRPVYMVIGGLHLAGGELESRIAPTTEFLAEKLKPAPVYVLPMHCSGFAAKTALREALGEGCVPAGTGIKFEVIGDAEFDERLPMPIID
ncbi:Metallo-hydrolase/oxidoreductase [Gloeophyllum trabeum ATCC 11539]|uniref:Metallo-hydrolase/oxidoreductase n=1 Tax=Gloeophyllum trabeum (strain ATCC 11539 / FP-39264 / Madison 617) TaxID=670483 RepID=S7QK45_GLOTA|nr:Metallo-hydrolase/oxidoreductase [Gloeophyllum trabeum ATCC 11539]EPQ60106.1 Metallo-hydrolase/oxidoreductase [Gloeophyllum trabeum ATCC 11539]